jgi:hypothetical protein
MKRTILLAAIVISLGSTLSADERCAACGPLNTWTPGQMWVDQDGHLQVVLSAQRDRHDTSAAVLTPEGWIAVAVPDKAVTDAVRSAREESRRLCASEAPYVNPDREEAVALRPHLRVGHSVEEQVSDCVEKDGINSFVLDFYEGEGADGIGGVGRFNTTTGEIEVRRDPWLIDKSAADIVDDGRALWFSTRRQFEQEPEEWGLVRYEWATGQLDRLGNTRWGPCGSRVNDVLMFGETLVVGTDYGLSILDLDTQVWDHLVFSGTTVDSVGCEEQMRSRLVAATKKECWNCFRWWELGDLVRVQPSRLRAVLLGTPELQTRNFFYALSRLARNFDEFDRYVWSRLPPDASPSERSSFATLFVTAGDRSPEWRALAIELAGAHGDWPLLCNFRGDRDILRILQEAARRPVAWGTDTEWRDTWSRDRAIEVMPWIGGGESLPDLIELLGVALRDETSPRREHKFHTAEIIVSIERAAHQRIAADGTTTSLAPDSDRPEYAEEEYGAFDRSEDELEDLEAIGRRWIAWWHDTRRDGIR